MNILIERTIELNAPLLTEPLPGSLFTTEAKAHQFLIACTQSGLPITLSGTVSAKFIREANNTTILMSGSISGGKASLILPADCYNISGRFDLTIFVTASDVTTCIYSATGSVKAAQDGTLVDEGTVVPSIEQLQQDVTNLQNNKVDRSGDTMTGPLNLRSATVFSTGDGYARLYFKDTVSGANLAAFNLLVSNRRLFATEYSAGSSNVERFYFPAPDANRTADGNYDILTTKDYPAFSTATDFVSSEYISTQYATKVYRKLGIVKFTALIALASNTPASTNINIGTIPAGYRPTENIRGIAQGMNLSWDYPSPVGHTGILVTVNSAGAITINRGSENTGGYYIDMVWFT